MPKLIAKERFMFSGKYVEKGEEFEATDFEARLLTQSLRPMADAKSSGPMTTQDLEPKTKRTYKTRHMTPEE